MQVVHLDDHWVCLTNYNPWLDPNNPYGTWHLYDSLQAPDIYVPRLTSVIHKFTDGVSCSINHVILPKQLGKHDCGLFALGYATALCMDINPASLIFNQSRMRQEFNNMVTTSEVMLFSHSLSIGSHTQCMKYSINYV